MGLMRSIQVNLGKVFAAVSWGCLTGFMKLVYLSSWVGALYTLWDSIAPYRNESQFGGAYLKDQMTLKSRGPIPGHIL